jgi:hypothetical protein
VAPLPAYRRLVAIMSLDGLVEASQLSRTLGGVSNDIHATMTRLLLEEYGGGRPARKHSAFFRAMLQSLEMCDDAEAYFDLVPWEVLAGINHSFLLSDRKRHFLRYVGGLLYTEVSVPSAFRAYRAAATRLGLPPEAMSYWDLHIKEDARHGPWMLNDVAIPSPNATRTTRGSCCSDTISRNDCRRAPLRRSGARPARHDSVRSRRMHVRRALPSGRCERRYARRSGARLPSRRQRCEVIVVDGSLPADFDRQRISVARSLVGMCPSTGAGGFSMAR